MIRYIYILLLLLIYPSIGSAKEAWRGFCEEGAQHVITSGLSSTTQVQQSHPSCLVTILVHGGGLAVIYSDNNGTPLANPFTANTNGQFTWYAANGRYDQVTTAAGFSQTTTYSDILLCDPADTASACGTAAPGAAAVSIFKNNVLVGVEPGIDFVEGTGISITPATDDPPNSRVHLTFNANLVAGTNITLVNSGNQTTINATGGGSGCTLPGTDTGVLSEHPVGTCLDSAHFTWDDTAFNFQVGNASNANSGGTTLTYIVGPGNNLAGQTSSFAFGDFNDLHAAGQIETYALGTSNTIANLRVGNSTTVSVGSNQIGNSANANSGGNDTFAFGLGNTIYNNRFSNILGYANTVGVRTAGGQQEFGQLHGYNNLVNTATGAGTVIDWAILGDSNSIGGVTNGTMGSIYLVGFDDSAESTCGGAYILGLDNHALGCTSNDVTLVGASLTSTASIASGSGFASDSAMFGTQSTMNAVGVGLVVGTAVQLSSCVFCGAIGFNVHYSPGTTSGNTVPGLALGVSTAAEIVLTPNAVTLKKLPFGSLPTCAAGTEGTIMPVTDSNTITWGATIAGSSTNHVLAYCDGTNWTVAAK